MCSHCQAIKERAKFEKEFRVKLLPYEKVYDVWPSEAPLGDRSQRVETTSSRDTLKNDGTFCGTFQIRNSKT